MALVIGKYDEVPGTIEMETSKKHKINNQQYTIIIQQEVANEMRAATLYNSTFQGEATKIYNCHGLTFACKRTGIFDNKDVSLILADEYIAVQRRDVIIGDVVLYIKDGEFLHSAIVVQTIESEIKGIRVLSKTRPYREIVHWVQDHPYLGSEIKYYRINHGKVSIIE